MFLRPHLLAATLLAAAAPAGARQGFETWRGFDVALPNQAQYLAAMELADLDGDGFRDLAAVSEHFFYCALVVRLGDGAGGFGPAAVHPLANGSRDLCAADLDGDGDLDLALSEGGSSSSGNTVAWFRNLGDGSFVLGQRLGVPTGPMGVAAGDLDGDGDTDLAVAILGNSGSGNQVRLLVNTNGVFASGPAVPVPAAPFELEVADLDQDGWQDLAVVHEDTDVLSLVLGGPGGFGAPQVFDVSAQTTGGSHLRPCLALLDLGHDGDLDVLFADSAHSTSSGGLIFPIVSVVENLGGGGFALGAPIRARSRFSDMDAADLDGDGWEDLMGIQAFDSGWSVLMSDGAGGFEMPSDVDQRISGDSPARIAAHDADLDGDLDALVLCRDSLSVSVHLFEGGQPVEPVRSPGAVGGVDAADIDGDGDLDLAGGKLGPIFVCRNQGDGTFAPPATYPSLSFGGAKDIKLRDVTGDGLPDLLWATLSDFGTRANLGDGTFGAATIWSVGTCGNAGVDAFDMDGDGDLDVFLSEQLGCPSVPGSATRVFVVRNLGGGAFGAPDVLDGVLQPRFLTHADVDLDGNLDLIVAANPSVEVLLGNGDGSFQPPVAAAGDASPRGVVLGDWNDDGLPDLATSNWGDGDDDAIQESMSAMLGNGDGSFGPAQSLPASYHPDGGGAFTIAAGDVDGDGDLDLLQGNYASNDVSLYRNDGDGVFQEATRLGGAFGLVDVLYADFDGDGRGDLLTTGASKPHISDSTVFVARGEAPAGPGAPYCFCDAGSPCGNSDAAAGCANSTGAGALLAAHGSASRSADDLVCYAANLLPNQPALLFAGEQQVNGGDGVPFGDGLRCAGTNVVRLGVRTPGVSGGASWGPGLMADAGWTAGVTRRLQVWYRDPSSGPCGSGYNLSNGVEVAIAP